MRHLSYRSDHRAPCLGDKIMTYSTLSVGRERLLRKLVFVSDWVAVVSLTGPEKTMLPFFLYHATPWVVQEQIDGVPRIKVTEAGRMTLFRHDTLKNSRQNA